MSNAIEVKNLCKHYPGFALKNVSFHVPNGLCCGFVGPNGAGKTTTLKAMLGMTLRDGGEISLLGKPDDEVTVKEELGVMFDQPYFQEDWTPLDVEKGIKPFYRDWDDGEYRRYLSRFGLDPKKKFKTFSRGMKMKLGLAVHLSHNAKLLLLDEPTGGLDPVARDEVLDILREYMVSDNRTILFSTHITSDLERIADLIAYISNGEISFFGEKDELTSSYCVVRGGTLPEDKRKHAIGLREHSSGYECLMALEHIGGLPSDTVTERATIDDVVVYMERRSKGA
ncbi:MAG: ABC transporter ATP-binding protein [Oscillospiraceae bacterium]|jgi:ABC-2 type transport system ATP-binding protein|nr:ABC transporter ATP-binding protein [Oscillospiraceae bacterium]